MIQHCKTKTHYQRAESLGVDPTLGLSDPALTKKNAQQSQKRQKQPQPKTSSHTLVKYPAPSSETAEPTIMADESDEQSADDGYISPRTRQAEKESKWVYGRHRCFLCNRKFHKLRQVLMHMVEVHSLQLDEPQYIVDMEGLLQYIAEKVWNLFLI